MARWEALGHDVLSALVIIVVVVMVTYERHLKEKGWTNHAAGSSADYENLRQVKGRRPWPLRFLLAPQTLAHTNVGRRNEKPTMDDGSGHGGGGGPRDGMPKRDP